MSRLDLDHPLQLLAEYSQAAMLALLWRPWPERICLLGLAGGRLSLLFYHYFPASTIDNVDVDPAVIPIATSYFGLTFDTRQTITIGDARAYLAALAPDIAYDIIVLDAFEDSTDALDHLATTQFYQECRRRLVGGGVLVVNMLKSDPRFLSKLKTLLHSFRHVAGVAQKHGLVLFGTDKTNLSQTAIMQRARQLQHQHQFEFPLIERAAALQPLRAHPAYPSRVLRAIPLLNDSPCSE
jgi:spermidine synthase